MAEEKDNVNGENLNENTTVEGEEKDNKINDSTENKPADDGSVKNDDSADKKDSDGEKVNPEDVDLENVEEVTKALDKKGVDYGALVEEYIANGQLSEKSMEALAAIGISPEMVEDYTKGAEARIELERNELAKCVGGREQMEEIIDWAAHNLSKEEIVELNSIRNKFQLETTLIGLKTRMENKEGKTPDYQKGTGDKATVNGFRSQAEMFEAIKDPKYQKDEAYRNDVHKKIAASREAGIDLGIY